MREVIGVIFCIVGFPLALGMEHACWQKANLLEQNGGDDAKIWRRFQWWYHWIGYLIAFTFGTVLTALVH